MNKERIREEIEQVFKKSREGVTVTGNEYANFINYPTSEEELATLVLSLKGIYTEKDIKEAEQRGAQKVVDWIKTRKSTLKVNGYPLLKNAYVIGETDLQAFLKEVEK